MTAGVTRKSMSKIKDETNYFGHQLDGIRTLARMGSFLLADEMGLGKSLQALTVAAIDFERKKQDGTPWANRVLIVCPASLKWNWEDEIKRHTRFHHIILNGTPEERRKQIELFEFLDLDIMICNYEQVKTHLRDFNYLNFDIIIYDEAHYIKNPKSERTKACLKLRAPRHFLLTGSPLLNQVNELWSLLHRIDPYRWNNYYTFTSRYCVFGGYRKKQIVGSKNKAELTAAVEKIMVRRLKKDVLDLPDKQYIPVYVELHELQRKLYDEANDDLQISCPNSVDDIEIDNPLTKYLKLKQICGTAAEIPGYEDVSAKLDKVVEMIEELKANGEKVVVFTQFRGVQRCLEARLDALKKPIKYYTLHGDVPKESRQEVIKLWSGDANAPVLTVMLQMGGVGYNMTAASVCIFIDRLYVPKLNEQAEDRLHRIGASKTKPIQIYQIIARKTIEQKIETMLRRKTKLFGEIIEESDWKRAIYAAIREADEEEAA